MQIELSTSTPDTVFGISGCTTNCTDSLRLSRSNRRPSINKFEFIGGKICKNDAYRDGICSSGVIGLNPQSLSSPSNFVKQAIPAGLFDKPQVSIHYQGQNGKYVFGGADTKHCASGGQTLSVKEDANEWNFQVSFITACYLLSFFGAMKFLRLSRKNSLRLIAYPICQVNMDYVF